jgi:mannitol/fructose-specific phosphotransferase system IIA component (Ntr-type)
MGTLSSALLPKDIHLDLRAANPDDALEEVLSTLRNDSRVGDWAALREALSQGSPIDCGPSENGMIILHHRRTPSISEMVLATGRFPTGLPVQGCERPLRMLFVAAIPESLNNEYLRVLGAISRVCGDPESFGRLMGAPDRETFLSLLEEGCRR